MEDNNSKAKLNGSFQIWKGAMRGKWEPQTLWGRCFGQHSSQNKSIHSTHLQTFPALLHSQHICGSWAAVDCCGLDGGDGCMGTAEVWQMTSGIDRVGISVCPALDLIREDGLAIRKERENSNMIQPMDLVLYCRRESSRYARHRERDRRRDREIAGQSRGLYLD